MKNDTNTFKIEIGENRNGQKITTLYKTSSNGCVFSEPSYLKMWTGEVTDQEIEHEKMLNDWGRWNETLEPGEPIEISEKIFYDLLECVPPHKMDKGGYFEVGEAHHHDNKGKAIYRACFMSKDGKYYTCYPKS